MKTRPILFLTAAMLFARAVSAQPGDVAIQFVSPEKFTDFRIYGLDVQWSASFFAREISDDLKPTLSQKFPGSKLTLRFTNINLAYNYRISRSALGVPLIRRPIAPERMSLVFLLQDTSGRTLASGSTRITDTSSHNALAGRRSGSELLYYEKQMLEGWLKSVRPLVEPRQSVPDAAIVKIRTQGGLLAAKP
jgi:Protein of unknown function (DUF3016)